MSCAIIKGESDNIIIMCGSFGSTPCRDCNIEAEFLCDYPVGEDKTCDAPLCIDHAFEVAPGIHYCKSHYDEFKKFEGNGGIKKYLENIVPYRQGAK